MGSQTHRLHAHAAAAHELVVELEFGASSAVWVSELAWAEYVQRREPLWASHAQKDFNGYSYSYSNDRI